jgi:hypothetical protein
VYEVIEGNTENIWYFDSYLLWEADEAVTSDSNSNSNKKILLIVFWILAVVIPIVLIKVTSK